ATTGERVRSSGKRRAARLGRTPIPNPAAIAAPVTCMLGAQSATVDPRNALAHHSAAGWCAKAFRGSTVALWAPSMQVTGAAIAAGLGIGVLPRRAARLFPLLRTLSPVVA